MGVFFKGEPGNAGEVCAGGVRKASDTSFCPPIVATRLEKKQNSSNACCKSAILVLFCKRSIYLRHDVAAIMAILVKCPQWQKLLKVVGSTQLEVCLAIRFEYAINL